MGPSAKLNEKGGEKSPTILLFFVAKIEVIVCE
jgi:hypothetical protein